jgi:hypothetical protein
MVKLTTPLVHEVVTAPPPLDEATVRSYAGERSVKAPPVVLERATMTLVAFTVRASAAEPVAIMSVVADEVIETDSAVGKLRGAALASPAYPRTLTRMRILVAADRRELRGIAAGGFQ